MRRPTRRFLFRLATHVYGVAHPDFIPDRLTRRQLAECQAYYQLEPWGPERDSWHAAQIATAVQQPWSKRRIKIETQVLKFGPSHTKKPKSLAYKLKMVAIGIHARMVDRGGATNG